MSLPDTDAELAALVCRRFDHLNFIELEGVVNAHGVNMGRASMIVLQQDPEHRREIRQHLYEMALNIAPDVRRMTPREHEADLVATGMIASFLKWMLATGATQVVDGERLEAVRRATIITGYDDLAALFRQGAVGQLVPSIAEQSRHPPPTPPCPFPPPSMIAAAPFEPREGERVVAAGKPLNLDGAFLAVNDSGCAVTCGNDNAHFVPVFSTVEKLEAFMQFLGLLVFSIKQVSDGRAFIDDVRQHGLRIALDPYRSERGMRWQEIVPLDPVPEGA